MASKRILLLLAVVAGVQIATATFCTNDEGTRTFYYDKVSSPLWIDNLDDAAACCDACDAVNEDAGTNRACSHWAYQVQDSDEVPAKTCRVYPRGDSFTYGSVGAVGECLATSVNSYPVPIGEEVVINDAADCCNWAVRSQTINLNGTNLEVRGFIYTGSGSCLLATQMPPAEYNPAESLVGLSTQNAYVQDDPHFKAFGGAWYEFFGYPNAVFNVLTAPKYQVNALFSNLGNEKVINNYMTKIGFMTEAAAFEVGLTAENSLTVTAHIGGKAFSQLTANVQPGVAYMVAPGVKLMKLPYTPKKTAGETVVLATQQIAVSVFTRDGENWLDLNINLLDRALPDMHGIVGQTWRGHTGVVPKIVNGTHVIDGAETDYEVVDGLLGKSFKYNQFELPAIAQGQTFSFLKASAAAIKKLGKVLDTELTTSQPNARRLLHGTVTVADPVEAFFHSMDASSVAVSRYAA